MDKACDCMDSEIALVCCFAGFFQTKPKQAWWRRRYGKVRAIQAKGYTILHSEREQNESCNYECA